MCRDSTQLDVTSLRQVDTSGLFKPAEPCFPYFSVQLFQLSVM